MDYRTALQHFTKRSPLRRRLDGHNNTWLHRDSTDAHVPIHVRLFQTNIISFFPDQSFSIRTNGYITATTKDRFRRYLPKGCNIWTFLQNGSYLVLLYTPKGIRPCRDDARFNSKFQRTDLEAMNRRCASDVHSKIREYSKAFIHRLATRGISFLGGPGDCALCMKYNELQTERAKNFETFDSACLGDKHFLEHIDKGAMPASVLMAAANAEAFALGRSAEALCTPSRSFLKPPKTKRAALEQAELWLMGHEPPERDPRQDQAALREALYVFLLERVGFRMVSPQTGLTQGMHHGMKTDDVMGWR